MTIRDKDELLRLLKQFDEEELNCNGNCSTCYYGVHSDKVVIDNCPLLIARSMVYDKIYKQPKWIQSQIEKKETSIL